MPAMPSRTLLLPLVLLPAALWMAACSPKPVPPEPVRAVRVMTVAPDAAGGVQEYAGEVRARTESRLGFRVAGKLVARPAEVGQRVRGGQPLAQLDPADLKLQQDAAQAALRAAQASVDFAAADFRRYEELRAQGFISAMELERRESGLKAQRAQLDQARAQAEAQGNLASYAVLTAPAAGVVTATEAEVGAVLAAGTTVLRLAHDGPRDVAFSVPEDAVAGMRALLGRSGALRVRPWAQSAALPATVREVAAAADPVTRTFLVRADIGAAPVQLGQTMTVLLELPRRDAAARLPLTAVMRQQGQTAVWVLDPTNMTVQVQPIVVAGADGNSVMVSGGLQPGQRVVTAGVHTLTPGQKVKLFEEDPVAPARPAASR
ncbi:MAG: efflux RND transporter periplasmic adaptor subunit [Burkholderiaceae bacterium]|jgi:RND family efflux transporter MFP subunit|nr:efflux RND transporter periplasmic adaptor subunit [Burkholderiaceae bacterium]MCZ8176165.1 efflux RND transporter periplasmic adaptor subunit [Burkholderiaceae bacterium]